MTSAGLIRNYGLFWRREYVFWGRQKNSGNLKGFYTNNKNKIVDFRDQRGIYVLYDDGFNLVYVGQAGAGNTRLFTRLKDHTTDHLADRWTKFSWFGTRRVLNTNCTLSKEKDALHPKVRNVLNHLEAVLISSVEPPHNRQGGRFGNEVEQYLQYYDQEKLGPTIYDMIKSLHISKK